MGQLHKKFGLLWRIQRYILLRRGPRFLNGLRQVRLSLDDFGGKASSKVIDKQAAILSAKNSEPNPADSVLKASIETKSYISFDGCDQVLVVVKSNLSVLQAYQNALYCLHPLQLQLLNTHNGGGHLNDEALFSFEQERV